MKGKTLTTKELPLLAGHLLKDLAKTPHGTHALVIGLSGNLGAGKTTFMKALARHIGIKNTVTSPTFILERIYKIPKKSALSARFDHLVHVDAYRLEGEKELRHLGWKEIVADPRNIIFIEWPERVKKALPKKMITLRFKVAGENTRHITW